MRKLLIAPLAAGVAAAAVVAADRVLRAVRPMTVPPGPLAAEVALARSAGFRLCNWHKFRCAEPAPHVHVTTPDGRVQVTITETMAAEAAAAASG